MFDPEWEDGCPSCSAGAEEMSRGHLEHLHMRDTTFAYVSRAPFSKIEEYRTRRGWEVPWYSSYGSDFNYDFHVTLDESVAPAEYNYRSQDEFRGPAPSSSSAENFPGARASCATATTFTTRTRSTRAGSRRSAVRTTCSTRPRSVARRSGRSPRGAPPRRAARCPTSRASGQSRAVTLASPGPGAGPVQIVEIDVRQLQPGRQS